MRSKIKVKDEKLIDWLIQNFCIEEEELSPNEVAYTFCDKDGDPLYYLDETGFYGYDWEKPPIPLDKVMTEHWTIIYQ